MMSNGMTNGELMALRETPNHLIALALERQADPNTLSKLMDLQERWEAGQARKAYVAAMTAFKQEAPAVLKKGDRVDFSTAKGRTCYNYANLGSIVQEITSILGKHELSASWGTSQEGNNVTVTCHVTHIAGHRESVTLTGPIDESGNKNRIQAVGSTVTYLQRYTLLAALGLATGEDDDGRCGADPGRPPVSKPQEKKPEGRAPEATGVQSITVAIDSVEVKTGKHKDTVDKAGKKVEGKPWTLFIIHAGDQKFNTISETFGKTAQESIDEKVNVILTYSETEKGKKVEGIVMQEAQREPGEEG